MALPDLIQHAHGEADGVKGDGWLDITFGASIPQDDIIVVEVITNSIALTSIPVGWSTAYSNFASSVGRYVLYRVAGASEGATIDVGSVASGAGGTAFGFAGTYRGGDPADPVYSVASDIYASNTDSSIDMVAPQAVNIVETKLVGFWMASYVSGGSLTHFGTPSGMTQRRRVLTTGLTEWGFSQVASFIYDEDLFVGGSTGSRTISRSSASNYGTGFLLVLNAAPPEVAMKTHHYAMMRG